MCVCIWKPAGKKVSKDILQRCWDRNPDGAGYMWSTGDKVKIRKGFMTFKKFWKSYKHASRKLAGTGIGIHFRIGTSGMLDRRNCHPHRVNEKLAFIHNGILPLEVPPGSTVSDSVLFAELLASLPEGWHRDIKVRKLVEMAMGGRNKICMLDETGMAVLLNEDGGNWEDGVWFSNMNWDDRPIETTPAWENTYWNGGSTVPNVKESKFSPTFKAGSWKGYRPSKAYKPGVGTKQASLKFRSVGEVYGAKRRDSQIEKEEDASQSPVSRAPESFQTEEDRLLKRAEELSDRYLGPNLNHEDKSGSSMGYGPPV